MKVFSEDKSKKTPKFKTTQQNNKNMYFIESLYTIENQTHLELFCRVFANVSGDVEFMNDGCETPNVLSGKNPFTKIQKNFDLRFPIKVHIKMSGPQSAMCTAAKIEKIDPNTFVHPRKEAIEEWACYIDTNVLSEMKRCNDLSYTYSRPSKQLNNMEELYLAAKISKYVYSLIPTEFEPGFYMWNPDCAYVPHIGLVKNLSSSIKFDLDEGFVGEDNLKNELNKTFLIWKNKGYEGNMLWKMPF